MHEEGKVVQQNERDGVLLWSSVPVGHDLGLLKLERLAPQEG